MKISDFKNKKVTIFGLGLSGGGAGAAIFFAQAGAKVTVTDLRTKEELKPSLKKLEGYKNITYILGQHRSEDFTKADLVVKTPAVSWANRNVKLALENNVPVEMDSSLFFLMCPAPIIGVTGSKGKTTTSSLIYEILKKAGRDPIKVGIGQVGVLDKLLKIKKDNIVVFEISSWRLSALKKHKISPQTAVITNILEDHLNYYSSMEKYIADKKQIFLYQRENDRLVVNWDDWNVREAAIEATSKMIRVSSKVSDEGVYIKRGSIYSCTGDEEAEEVAEIEDINVKGKHNIKNIMLAIAATKNLGISKKTYTEVIKSFQGIEHRLEFVRDFNGVKYYNDSSATIPEASIQAIKAFLNPVILICGGSDKNLNFTDFARVIVQNVKGCVFIKGTATEKIIAELKKILRPEEIERGFEIVSSMKKAVESASLAAEKGDIVLLSPGSASFGVFKNEFDRGNQFKEEVDNLA